MLRRLGLSILLALSGLVPSIPVYAQEVQGASVLINELQTGGLDLVGLEDGRQEFIELYNQTPEEIDVNDWKIQYFAASREDVSDPIAPPTREIYKLTGSFAPLGKILLSFEGFITGADGYFGVGSTSSSGLLARSGGHVRILDESGSVVDVVGWGTAKSAEIKPLSEIDAGYSAVRKIIDDVIQDTDNNFDDFIQTSEPSPEGGSLIEPVIEEVPEVIVPFCDGLVISEVLPNPEGTDKGNEFIELYNPTSDEIVLGGCVLKTSGSSKEYAFTDDLIMLPGEYRAFYDSVTGLTLANAAGGEVLLTGTTSDFVTQYPASMLSNHAWILLEGLWHDSSKPTPSEPNILSAPEASPTIDEEVELEPCPVGKFRNPETNRCKNIQVTAASLTPCTVGQARNPETNRCRNIASLASSLVPCRQGQERNPETNRCRNVAGASTTQAECQPGYERNPDTNRCRKVAAAASASPSVGSTAPDAPQRLNAVFLVTATIAVLGYAVYEYRRDISNLKAWIQARRSAKQALR